MRYGKLGIFFTIAVTIAGAHAQTIYKSVGPDGKMVYSDKPPTSSSTKYDVIRTPAPAQQLQSPASSSTASVDPVDAQHPRSYGAKKAVAVTKPRDEAKPVATADRLVEGAVIGVLGIDDLVRRTEDLCTRTLPTSYKRYSSATDGWKQRNAAVVSQAHRVLSQAFTLSERQNIEAGLLAMNEQKFARVVDAPRASKISWCDRSTDEIGSGAMDVHGNPNLAPPLMSYRLR